MVSAITFPYRLLPAVLVMLVAVLSLASTRAAAQPVFSNSVITVTTLVDELDASVDSSLGAGTSLREAIIYANPGDAINFGPTVRGSIFLTLGEIVVSEDMFIIGPGPNSLEINGNDLQRILRIESGVSVAISDLTFSSGRAPAGGAILSQGWLSLELCTIRWSTAIGHGGAIHHDGDTLRLSYCRFLNNDAFQAGGAVYVNSGEVFVEYSTFQLNGAGTRGGALYLGASSAHIVQTTFSENVALNDGGALEVASTASAVIERSTANDNRARIGGGLSNRGSLTLLQSTLSGNIADNDGGGLRNFSMATIDFSTIAFNSASTGGGARNSGTLSTKRTIFASNTAFTDPQVNGSVTSTGTNLIEDIGSSTGWINSDLKGASNDPMNAALDELRLNGGWTKTHALLVCSRAVDAADSTGTFNMTDQRGSARKVNGDNDGIAMPDIGAYEAQGILDTQEPSFTPYPGYIVRLDSATGTATLTADDLILSTFDNCEVVSKSISKTNYTCSDIGTVSVTLTVTDRSFNTKTQNIDVFVVDQIVPTVTPPADVTVNAPGNTCGAVVSIGTPTVFDACGYLMPTNNAPAVFPIGTTTVLWTVEDNNGNLAIAKQEVTVIDNTTPVLTVPPAVTVTAHPTQCSISRGLVTLGNASATDNCSVTISNNAPAFFPLGQTTVIWTAVDASGNAASGNQLVTVVDQTPPTIFAPGDLRLAADAGVCWRDAANVNLGTPSAVDNCSPVTVTNNAPSVFPIGQTTVTWTATDANNNSASATQKVVIFDGIPPIVTAPPDIEVQADAGTCYWTVDTNILGTATGVDNCGLPSVVNNAGSTLAVGTHRIIWTAIDGNGNRSTDVQIVTVVGDPPSITCPANIVVNTDPGMAGAVVTFAMPTANSSCADVEIIRTGGLGSGSFFPLGTTTVSYMAIDGSNQIDVCSFDVTVVDNEAPQIWVKVAPRFLWPADNKLYDIKATVETWDNVPGTTAELVSIQSNQNDNGDIVDADYGVFDTEFKLRAKRGNGPRVYVVTYKATDAANNVTFGTATVTVPTNKPKEIDIEEGTLPVPEGVSLAQNYPNPFNPSTTISFGTPDQRHMHLVVYDIMGRPVRTLFDVVLDAGSYSVDWDGRSDAGEVLPSGLYIYQLRAGDQRLERKMLLAR